MKQYWSDLSGQVFIMYKPCSPVSKSNGYGRVGTQIQTVLQNGAVCIILFLTTAFNLSTKLHQARFVQNDAAGFVL